MEATLRLYLAFTAPIAFLMSIVLLVVWRTSGFKSMLAVFPAAALFAFGWPIWVPFNYAKRLFT